MGLTIGNPLGGALMQLDGMGGLHGWQWMFLLEGLPTVIFGIVLWFIFPDRPRDARWLTADEASALERNAAGAKDSHAHAPSKDWVSALKRPSTVLIALIYFLNQIGFVGLYFFIPSMVQQMQASTPLMVGLLSSTVGIGFLLGVLILPRIKPLFESDMMFLGVVTTGLLISATIFLMVSLPAIHLVLFTTTAFFAGGILPIFWSIAMKRLQGIQAAAGLAFINTIGLMGGFVGPYIFGLVERETGRSASGFIVIAVTAALGLVLITALAKALRTESRPQDDGLLVPSHT